jgi:HTH-type transcriptional regulator, sugar sensing transcriptional regulator
MLDPRQLDQFGLSEKEARVYLAVLQLGESSVQVIAAKAEIHRVSTYDILDSLIEKGFVRKLKRGSKTVLSVVEPEATMADIRRKSDLFASLLPELNAMRTAASGIKPAAMYLSDFKEINKAIVEALSKQLAGSSVFLFASSDTQSMAKFIAMKIGKQCSQRNIELMSIINVQNSDSVNVTDRKESFGEIKLIQSIKKLNRNTIIFNDKILTIDWVAETALLIVDEPFVFDQQVMFEIIWGSLPANIIGKENL